MVRPPDQLFIRRHRRPRHAATFNIVIMREELQQFGGGGGGESEDRGPRMRDGRPRGGDDHRRNCNSAITGKATERISSAEWHALVLAKLGLLLDLIQIMYQNRSDSPFQTHPATMAISLVAICISAFAAAALFNSKAVKVEEEQQTTGHFLYRHRILDMLVLISGVVTLPCFVSVFVPVGLGWQLFVSCASTISALVGAWHFLFLPIFGRRTNSGHGAAGPSMV